MDKCICAGLCKYAHGVTAVLELSESNDDIHTVHAHIDPCAV